VQNAVDTAGEAGIPIISVEAYLQGKTVITEIAANQYLNGMLCADEIINYLKGSGKVLIVHTDGFHSLDLRLEGFKMKLGQYPGIELVGELPHTWENILEVTQSNVESYLTANPGGVDVIYAGWDVPVVGAAKAIMGLKLEDKIKVIGIDAFVPVVEIMRANGPILSVVNQDPNYTGIISAKAALRFLDGKELPMLIVSPLETVRHNYPGYPSNLPKGFHYIETVSEDLKALGLTVGPEDVARAFVLDK
jgi:ribose transport system substrate-binding protein